MMVMVANNSSKLTCSLAKAFTGRIGWLQGPSHWKEPRTDIPYALDNDAFTAWRTGKGWDRWAWFGMLERAAKSGIQPLWALVPDVVANREATIANWHRYARYVQEMGWQTAFAVQDGMKPCDVPSDADLVFVGGTTAWKWTFLPMWSEHFPRVHVGRVRKTKLLICEQLGVESVDGTGWFRDSQHGNPAQYLRAWIEGHIKPHPELFTR